jgi:hypothetical protein
MYLLFLISVIISILAPFQEQNFVKTKIGEAITLELPADFSLVPESEIFERYLSYRIPLAIYASPDGKAELTINTSVTQWAESDLEMMKSFYRSSIQSFYNKVEFISEDISEVNGKRFVILKFTSLVADAEDLPVRNPNINKFNYVQYTLVNNKTVVFSFSCPAATRNFWEPVAQTILESVKIKKTL